MMEYSIVIPVYKNEESIQRLLAALEDLVGALDGTAEVVFVVDASPDGSLDALRLAASKVDFPIQILVHARNFGAFAAIRTGLNAARGQYISVMAADLQEPPELLAEFFRLLKADMADVVVGRRTGRSDGISSVSSAAYWWLYRRLVIPELPEGGVDVFGLNRRAATTLLDLRESSSSLVGQLYWIGFRRAEVAYERQKRLEGRSAWTQRKKFGYMADSIFAFTALPIRLLQVVGAIGLIVSLLLSVIVLISWSAGKITVPGYTSLVLTLIGCTFLIVLSLGIVGNYVWRTYENSKARPLAIVRSVEQFNS